MAGIMLDVVVGDDGTVAVKGLEKALREAGDEGEKSGKKGAKGISKIAKAAKKAGAAVRKMGQAIGAAAGIAAGALVGALGMVLKMGIDMNASLEASQTAFRVLTGDARRAANIMRELKDFSASTPFQIQEIAQAAKSMEVFGVGGRNNLRIVGDAAATAQIPINELADTIGRIASGANMGEAFNRLGELALVTRTELEGEGLVFDRGGSYVGTAEDAFDAVIRIMDRKFAGMMEEMSQTWIGKISTMKDNFLLTAAEMSAGLFEELKPSIDRVTAIFADMRESGTAAAVGKVIAKAIGPIVDTIIGWLEKLPETIQNVIAATRWVGLLFEAIRAGFEKARDVTAAFFLYLEAGAKSAVASIKAAFEKINPFGEGDNAQAAANAAAADADHYRQAISDALDKPGFGDVIRSKTWDQLKPDFELATAPEEGGPGLDIARVENENATLEEIKALNESYREQLSEIWQDYTANIAELTKEGFVDVISAQILETGGNLRDALDSIWEGLKTSFVRMTVEMGINWLMMKAKIIAGEAALREAERAAAVKETGVAIGLNQAQTSSYASTAASKYYAAHAAIPFAGIGIANAMVGQMLAGIATAKASAGAFRTGGLVPGGGSGAEDNRSIFVSGNEYIQPASAVSQYGVGLMDSIRRGTFDPSGGATLNLTLVGSAQELDEAEVEEALVPVLEKLNKQSRFRVTAN